MKIWDTLLPDNKPIIIWGAGKNGKEWASFILGINKEVYCFFDENARVSEIRVSGKEFHVFRPRMSYDGGETLLISVCRGIDEIYSKAQKLGFNRIVVGETMGFIPKTDEISTETGFKKFGHFYSLYPSFSDINKYYDDVIRNETSGMDKDAIDLNDRCQIEILERMNSIFDTLPDWIDIDSERLTKYRYRKNNPSIGLSDTWLLHFILRIFTPKNLIEVGSGYTSAATLDTNEYYLGGSVNISFIEPYPQLLHSLMKPDDLKACSILSVGLQDVPLEEFQRLGRNDILFIDSTHVSKFHSDVNYLFFHILPCLSSGVIVHIHDIFYPWEYPKTWIKKGMGWNEMYLLRAFLQYNTSWEVLFFNHYMANEHMERYNNVWREINDLGGGSFWMRKK